MAPYASSVGVLEISLSVSNGRWTAEILLATVRRANAGASAESRTFVILCGTQKRPGVPGFVDQQSQGERHVLACGLYPSSNGLQSHSTGEAAL